MKNILAAVLAGVLLVLVFAAGPAIRAFRNRYDYAVQKADDATNYRTLKEVEDTCRAMIASYEAEGRPASLDAPGIYGLSLAHKHLPEMRVVCGLEIWQFGSSMVMFLAALKNVPSSLYEAAEIDGAGWWKRFFHITIPQISPIIFFTLLNQTIQELQNYTSPAIITTGGPRKSTYVLGMFLYQEGFAYFHMGYASAISWIEFIVILILTLVIFGSSRFWVHYSDE